MLTTPSRSFVSFKICCVCSVVVDSFKYKTRSTFSLRLSSEDSVMKLIARIMLNMKIIIPITKIVAIERNLFLYKFERLKRRALFRGMRGEGFGILFSY